MKRVRLRIFTTKSGQAPAPGSVPPLVETPDCCCPDTGHKPKRKRHYRAAERIKLLAEQEMSQGTTINDLKAMLTSKESRILEEYILAAAERPSLDEMAARLGLSKMSVMQGLRAIENRLHGRHPRAHLFEKYEAMTNDGLKDAIISSGAKSRSDLNQHNNLLFRVAKDRGVLDEIYPIKQNKALTGMKGVLDERLKFETLEQVMAGLTAVEKDIITKKVMAKKPAGAEYFANTHGLGQRQLCARQRSLLTRLRSDSASKRAVRALRALAGKIGTEKMGEIMPRLSAQERDILVKRACSENPEALRVLGARFGCSGERIRQIERNLCIKLRRLNDSGVFSTFAGSRRFKDGVTFIAFSGQGAKYRQRLREIHALLQESGKLGEVMSALHPVEAAVLADSAAAMPIHLNEVYRQLGLRYKPSALPRKLVRILEEYLKTGSFPTRLRRSEDGDAFSAFPGQGAKYRQRLREIHALLQESGKLGKVMSALPPAEAALLENSAAMPIRLNELYRQLGLQSKPYALPRRLVKILELYLKTGSLPRILVSRLYRSLSRNELLERAKQHSGRTDCLRHDDQLYRELKQRNMLSVAFGEKKRRGRPRKHSNAGGNKLLKSDEEILRIIAMLRAALARRRSLKLDT